MWKELKDVCLSKDDMERIERMAASVRKSCFPLCTEKLELIHQSYLMNRREPEILRQARAIEHVLLNIPIWIDRDEKIVGHGASKPWGVELDPFFGFPPMDEILNAAEEGVFKLGKTEKDTIERIAESGIWESYAQTTRGFAPLDDRLGPFLETGIWLPPQTRAIQAMGHYGSGLNITSAIHVSVPNFEKVLHYGLWHFIKEAERERSKIRHFSPKSIEKALFLDAIVIVLKSVVRFAGRYADLADRLAEKETDVSRKHELKRIAEICRRVPGFPAQSFREALQSYWFWYLMHNPSNVVGMGRFDQLLYPFYKNDKRKGKITDSEVLALLCELRIKDMELISCFITREKRKQFSGFAKWHNMVIGGVNANGDDATNELSFLVLQAAKLVRTPHHTISLRVHERTPDELMLTALELVRTGIGMPAFLGDQSYIDTLKYYGVPEEVARNYAIGGCLDVVIPGQVYRVSATFFAAIKVFEMFLNNGIDPRTDVEIRPFGFAVEDCNSFEEFFGLFEKYYDYCMSLWVECINNTCWAWAQYWHHLPEASLLDGNIVEGTTFYKFKLPYDMAAVVYPVGLINVANSFAAIKKLVFEEKKITLADLKSALRANWQGWEHLRKLCLSAPKYGNDDDYVDKIAADLYKLHSRMAQKYNFIFGGKVLPGGISITSMWAAGSITGATPDGRYAGDVTADGTHSPQQGTDVEGPTAVIKSASKIDQTEYLCALLNMKFHPSALRTIDDLRKLGMLIRTYFALGGKHVQFNVVDRQTLLEAQLYPEKYPELIVRVAGYSAYFTQLSKPVQDDIIKRTELAF